MSKVTNQFGAKIETNFAYELFPDDVLERMNHWICDTEQEWFNVACRIYKQMYGKEFLLNNSAKTVY